MHGLLAFLHGLLTCSLGIVPLAQVAWQDREVVGAQEAAAPLEVVAAPRDGVPVLVVDGETGEPVEGALVTFARSLDDPWFLAPEPQLRELRRELGVTVRTDSNGMTRVARSSPILASSKASYGLAIPTPAWELPWRIALVPARALVVVVVDEEDRPVSGVRVRLGGGPQGIEDPWTVSTDENGTARFGPLDVFLGCSDLSQKQFAVTIEAPLKSVRCQSFHRHEIPEDPIRLVMPPTGALTIDVVDERGDPVAEQLAVSVEPPRVEELPAQTRVPLEGYWGAVDQQSRLVVPHVELELHLSIDVWGDLYGGSVPLIAGPTEPGETVVERVVCRSPPRISARVVDADGRALPDLEVLVRACRSEKDPAVRTLGVTSSDEAGRIEIPVQTPYANDLEEGFMEVHRRDGDGVSLLSGQGPLRQTGDRRYDAGVIRLTQTPLLVSGRVVDDQGAPVGGAIVQLLATPPFPRGGGVMSITQHGFLKATTRNDGSFTIRGQPPEGTLDLYVIGPGVLGLREYQGSGMQRFEPGAEGLTFTLWRAGFIAGSIVGDPAPLEDLSFEVSWTRTDGKEGRYTGIHVRPEFLLWAAQGLARIELRREDGTRDGATLAVRENIGVEPGQVTRLEPIVLRPGGNERRDD